MRKDLEEGSLKGSNAEVSEIIYVCYAQLAT